MADINEYGEPFETLDAPSLSLWASAVADALNGDNTTVDQRISAALADQGVPAGGTADQVLSKVDGTDYNTQWTSLPESSLDDLSDVTALNAPAGAHLVYDESLIASNQFIIGSETSGTVLSGTVSNVFDSDDNTFITYDQTATGVAVRWEYDRPVIIEYIDLVQGTGGVGIATVVVLESSATSTGPWNTVQTWNTTATQQLVVSDLNKISAYHWRLRATSDDGSSLVVRTIETFADVGSTWRAIVPQDGVPSGGTTGQVLSKIDGTDYNTQWVDQTGGGAASLDDLTDVTVPTPTTGDVLTYNGAEWTSATGPSSLDGLTDVIAPSPNNGDHLVYVNEGLDPSQYMINSVASDLFSGTPANIFDGDDSTSAVFNGYPDVEWLRWEYDRPVKITGFRILQGTNEPAGYATGLHLEWADAPTGPWTIVQSWTGLTIREDIVYVSELNQISKQHYRIRGNGDDNNWWHLFSLDIIAEADAAWKSVPLSLAVDDLTDVNAPTPSTGEVLTYDGAEWVNAAPAAGGASVAAGITPGEWQEATLLNGWVNNGAGYPNAAYRKDSLGVVHLRGVIKSGTTTIGTVLFNLPAGYQSDVPRIFSMSGGTSSSTQARVDVKDDGTVQVVYAGGNNYLALDGISFLASTPGDAVASSVITRADPGSVDWASTTSGSAFAFKGNRITVTSDVYVVGLSLPYKNPSGGTFKGIIFQGTTTIASIVAETAEFTPDTTSSQHRFQSVMFDTPVQLLAGQDYNLVVGRTDAGDGFALDVPVDGASDGNIYYGDPFYSRVDLAVPRIVSATPIVGTTVDRTAAVNASVAIFPLYTVTEPLQGPAGEGVPVGGTTGQVLAKIDGTDYNTEWVDQTGGGGPVALDDLTDVTVPTPATGDVLAYDGAEWVSTEVSLTTTATVILNDPLTTLDNIGASSGGWTTNNQGSGYIGVTGLSLGTQGHARVDLPVPEPGASGAEMYNAAEVEVMAEPDTRVGLAFGGTSTSSLNSDEPMAGTIRFGAQVFEAGNVPFGDVTSTAGTWTPGTWYRIRWSAVGDRHHFRVQSDGGEIWTTATSGQVYTADNLYLYVQSSGASFRNLRVWRNAAPWELVASGGSGLPIPAASGKFLETKVDAVKVAERTFPGSFGYTGLIDSYIDEATWTPTTSQSSQLDVRDSTLAIDQNFETHSHTQNIANSWWQVDVGSDKTVIPTHIGIQIRNSTGQRPGTLQVQGSNDGSTFDNIGVLSGGASTAPGDWFGGSISTSVGYRYIRLLMISNDSSGANYLTFGEFEMWGTIYLSGNPTLQWLQSDIDFARSTGLAAGLVPRSDGLDGWSYEHVIPAGGNTGQVLAKSSNDDYSVVWTDQTGGGGGAVGRGGAAAGITTDNQAISSGTTVVDLEQTFYESGDVSVDLLNNTFTVVSSGLFMCTGEVTFGSADTGTSLVQVSVNGGTTVGVDLWNIARGDASVADDSIGGTRTIQLSENDVLRFQIVASGANTLRSESTYFTVTAIGGAGNVSYTAVPPSNPQDGDLWIQKTV